jgi:peptide/nickel transport system substrate-binding protein
MISRRALLRSAASAAALALSRPPLRAALASPRVPYGGRLVLHVPWPLSWVDPHRVDDATAALFGEALFDTLYVPGEGGTLVPVLAEDDPRADGAGLRVPLRTGVRFASGAPFDARAAAASLARARSRDAGAWLADIPAPRVDGNALVFAMRDAHKLATALAAPIVAVVPPRFSPERPDGTGPFRADLQPGGLVLGRNTLAAQGPSLLDVIEARHAPDLVTSLRAFESGADDIGWLGSFLHEPRAGARSFDAGFVAWAILRTGREAGPLDAPGTAQALADGVPRAALASLVVGPPSSDDQAAPVPWTGPPSDLLVRDDSPWLLELARALAVALSSPGHEVTPRGASPADVAARKATRAFVLLLDVARPLGPGSLGALLGLATADDAASAIALALHPPRGDMPPRVAARTMRLGVLAEIRLQGGRAPDVVLPPSSWGRGIDWGGAARRRPV